MNRRIRRLMREIERRGGKLYVHPTLPDDMTELFLAEILQCPDCSAAVDGGPFEPEPPRGDRARGKGH